jgi:hypothetical protein
VASLVTGVVMLGLMFAPLKAEAWRGKWETTVEIQGDVISFSSICRYSLFIKECNQGETLDGFGLMPE